MNNNSDKLDKKYNKFHASLTIQKRIISENNFTYRKIIKILNPIVKSKTLNILDYGCGVGTIDFFLANMGHSVIGVDISPKAISICKKSAKAIGVSANTKFKMVNSILGKFDLIICSEVLEHLKNDYFTVRKLVRLLNNKGKIIVSVPSTNAPLFKIQLTEHFDIKVGHLRRYSVNSLRDLIKRNNLKVLKIYKTEGILRNSLYVFPSLNRIVKFLKGPLSDLVTLIDDATIKIFGESNIYMIAEKI
ncbi:MAG: methyltransferase domain-containing protein [Patescibacteria group bacterium]